MVPPGSPRPGRPTPAWLKRRTQRFAAATVRLSRRLPRSPEGRVVTDQLIRAGTSVGANYRAVCRARTRREFVAKLGIVIEECDEALFWLELIVELGLLSPEPLRALLAEGNEILAIVVTARRTAEGRTCSPRPG